MDPEQSVTRRLIEAALEATASSGWQRLALADVARAAGVGLAETYALFPTKGALLRAIVAMHDEAVLAPGPADPADPPRDRLFEVLMRRFDALQAHRAGMRALLRDVLRDPLALATLGPALGRSLAWMLEAAGLGGDGPAGVLRGAGLGLVYLNALRTWLDDDSPDLARTMAAVDRGLREAEGLAGRCALLAGGDGTAGAAPVRPASAQPPTGATEAPPAADAGAA